MNLPWRKLGAIIEAAAWKEDTQRGISKTSKIQLEIGRYVAKDKGESRMKSKHIAGVATGPLQ